ncbi:CPXCG motif-containing cysteine-rich protein [Polaribacter aestuariivivens]|nr:CPXCG motif-containing cysteine-rich protein [Polaribacter aestuariivivens]
MEQEHYFQCPYCWEEISMILDASVYQQTYIEDCEVCCNPIEITPTFEAGELISFNAQSIEQ